jgi:hypothetical protein
MSNNCEVEFNRLSLKPGDDLVIKVNTDGLTEEQAVNRLQDIADDPFVEYIRDKGHKVYISYTGVDISILRLEENDKVIVNADVTGMNEQEIKKYIDYVEFKLSSNIDKERLVIVPKHKQTDVKVLKEDKK